MTRKTFFAVTVPLAVAIAGLAGFIWSGFYNVAADDPHSGPVYAVLETLRERSIQVRAGRLQVPDDLLDSARITQGSGNYNAMCMGCHLAPGMDGTEMSRGLYPAPPDLTRYSPDAAKAFWVIKHGIKASGMPAWGASMDDQYIWNMAAFLQALPRLDAGQYQAMVDSSGGHDHGGGETEPHDHAPGTPADHPHPPASAPAAEPHAHPPGTPPHDDAAAGSDTDAGVVQARPTAGDARDSHDHPPGTPADHHAPAAAKARPVPVAEPAPQREVPSLPPATDVDGHGHEH